MVFDPVDGRTLLLRPDEFDVLETVLGFIDGDRPEVGDVVARVLAELDPPAGGPAASDDAAAANIRHWVEIALRLSE